MANTNVRISQRAYLILKTIADKEAKPMPALLDEAIESLRRRRFLEDANQAFAVLKANPKAWQEELDERAMWDRTNQDGVAKR